MPHNLLPSRRVLFTPHTHALCHFMQSHIRKVNACSAVTCHLHFWQDDWDLLCATAVTRGWNGQWNRSQYRKLTLEKKLLLPLLQRFKPVTFQSPVQRSNLWAIPTPYYASIYTQAHTQAHMHARTHTHTHTHTHICMHARTIWGQWTDRAKGGHCPQWAAASDQTKEALFQEPAEYMCTS